jgi:TRAP-type uncharacterized transport system fused permease subunit
MIGLGILRPYKGQHAGLKDAHQSLIRAGFGSVELISIVAGAGVVIGVLNATGGGFAMTLALVSLAKGSIIPLLLVGAAVCIILGMGMPTAGVYVLLAALVSPAFIEAGVNPLAAHMFVLYFGMMSMITPPIALACFAAAALTKASPMKTGIEAMKLGWVAYVVPFLFVFSPSLLMIGTWTEVILSVFTSTAGVALLTAGAVGYFIRSLFSFERLAFASAGLLLLAPSEPVLSTGLYINAIGLMGAVATMALSYIVHRRDPERS